VAQHGMALAGLQLKGTAEQHSDKTSIDRDPPLHFLTCGSTMRGHLRALLMMSALSILRLSLGSPFSSHARIVTGSPITLASLK
jgi:hypothetical protein